MTAAYARAVTETTLTASNILTYKEIKIPVLVLRTEPGTVLHTALDTVFNMVSGHGVEQLYHIELVKRETDTDTDTETTSDTDTTSETLGGAPKIARPAQSAPPSPPAQGSRSGRGVPLDMFGHFGQPDFAETKIRNHERKRTMKMLRAAGLALIGCLTWGAAAIAGPAMTAPTEIHIATFAETAGMSPIIADLGHVEAMPVASIAFHPTPGNLLSREPSGAARLPGNAVSNLEATNAVLNSGLADAASKVPRQGA